MSDKKPIIKILFYKTKEAYFGLSADERKQLAIKTTKDVVDVGGRWLTRCGNRDVGSNATLNAGDKDRGGGGEVMGG